jgi:hypothetical protein
LINANTIKQHVAKSVQRFRGFSLFELSDYGCTSFSVMGVALQQAVTPFFRLLEKVLSALAGCLYQIV